ncbi:tetratricopeptide repeat protein [Photobacterium ganghwense]|uniref:tetratricopeptide repeat protein n=1 Tax=Photobacterium ganghwense TaxID=320778 RepID=UPI001C2DC063|nr:tetratricopeptide repeat protein [Photobacterium ganghwense]MBV1839692.1 tetratricopeptide repeat protein [Photobacterium ganghwense]
MMKKFTLVALLAIPLSVASVHAADLSQGIANKVQRANTLQQNEKLGEAINLLKGLNPSREYDKAYVQRMLGVFYWQSGNKNQAITNLQKAVESGLLQDEQAWVTRRMLADILLSSEKFRQALPHYYTLSKSVPENQNAAELWLRIAQSHYQLEQWNDVLKAVAKRDRFLNKTDKHSLNMKLGAQLQLQQWKGAVPTLEALIALEPNHVAWWQQLTGIQLRLGRSHDALNTMALAKRQGVALTQRDLRSLAQLYAQRGIPERAAQQIAELEGAESDSELLAIQAQYWQMAREWNQAVKVWELAANRDNKYRWQLAQLLLQEGHYRQALTQLQKVTDKRRAADVELAKVRAYYKLTDFDKAIIHAKRADNIQSTSTSQSWIRYLNQMRKMDS